jgi:hypothetical protein
MKSKRNSLIGLLSTVLTLVLAPMGTYAQGDLGFRFIHGSVGIRDLAPAYGPYYNGAAVDFWPYTGLNMYWSSNQTLNPPFSGDVAFSEANYGATGWNGLAVPYNALNQPCGDATTGALTGNCTYTMGADYAWIKFNTYYLPSPTAAQRNHLLRHEFSHVLGLAHSGCYPSTGVMAPGVSCSPLYSILQPIEAAILDSWY